MNPVDCFHTKRKSASINCGAFCHFIVFLHLPEREKGGFDFIVLCDMCHGMLALLLYSTTSGITHCVIIMEFVSKFYVHDSLTYHNMRVTSGL